MGPPHLRRLYAQIILTVLCIILCLLKDPKMLVGVSSLGLFAIAGGFITLIMYACNCVVNCLASEVLATECISLTTISGPSPSRPSFRILVLLCTAWDSFCSSSLNMYVKVIVLIMVIMIVLIMIMVIMVIMDVEVLAPWLQEECGAFYRCLHLSDGCSVLRCGYFPCRHLQEWT